MAPVATDEARAIRVSFDLGNAGPNGGAEVTQVYLGFPESIAEPPKRLVGWAKVQLAAGQRQRVTVDVYPKAASHPISFWNVSTNAWEIPNGNFTVYVGDSSEDIRLVSSLRVVHHKMKIIH